MNLPFIKVEDPFPREIKFEPDPVPDPGPTGDPFTKVGQIVDSLIDSIFPSLKDQDQHDPPELDHNSNQNHNQEQEIIVSSDEGQSQEAGHGHGRGQSRLIRRSSISRPVPFYTDHFTSIPRISPTSYDKLNNISNSNPLFKCSVCCRSFSTSWDLDNHRRTFHSKILSKQFTCRVCGKEYLIKRHYNMHILKHKKNGQINSDEITMKYQHRHSNTKSNSRSSKKNNSAKSQIHSVAITTSKHLPISTSFKCDLCPNTYFADCESLLEHTLQQHVEDNDEFQIENQNRVDDINERPITSTSTSKSAPKFQPNLKRTKIDSPPNRKKYNHIKISTTSANFGCSLCFKSFERPSSLRAHISQAHTRKANENKIHPFKCVSCPKSYRTKAQLRHHEAYHLGVRSFWCDLCPKTFLRSVDLTAHKWTHNAIKKYVCPQDNCPKSFSSYIGLKLHEAKYHGGHTPFKCLFPECGKSFVHQSLLDEHYVVHTTSCHFQCDICFKYFKSEKRVVMHKRVVHFKTKTGRLRMSKGALMAMSMPISMPTPSLNSNLGLDSDFDQDPHQDSDVDSFNGSEDSEIIFSCKVCNLFSADDERLLAVHYDKDHKLPVVPLERIMFV